MTTQFAQILQPIFGEYDFWTYEYFGNTVHDYALAFLAFVGLLIVFQVFQAILLHRLNKLAERTQTDLDDTLIQIVRTLRPPFYSFVAVYIALQFVTTSGIVDQVLDAILVIWATYQATVALAHLVDFAAKKALLDEDEANAQSALMMIRKISKGVLWVLGGLFVLSNVGVDVTSFIAGLGIGGIAIALALQNILSDLFSSFAIYFDKPFVVGDFIIVGDKMGTVERIGIKTTRIRALQGEELVISNQELTNAHIQNFKKMNERRIVFSFGVTYDTPPAKLKEIAQMVRDIIEAHELARCDRVHFKSFGDSALNYEAVYFMQTPEYNDYMDTQQSINLAIVDAFAKEGVEMAFPTRTVYIQNNGKE